jgi:hypothetical protein
MQIPAVRWRDVLDKGKKRQKGATTEKKERDGGLFFRADNAPINALERDMITAVIETVDLDLASFRGRSRMAIALSR